MKVIIFLAVVAVAYAATIDTADESTEITKRSFFGKIKNFFTDIFKTIETKAKEVAKKFHKDAKLVGEFVMKNGKKLGHLFESGAKNVAHFFVKEGKNLKPIAEDAFKVAEEAVKDIASQINYKEILQFLISKMDTKTTQAECEKICDKELAKAFKKVTFINTNSVCAKMCPAALKIIEEAAQDELNKHTKKID